MNWKMFLRDKGVVLVSGFIFIMTMYLLGYAFQINLEYINALAFLIAMLVATNFLMEYWKKRRFYKDFLGKLEGLDQKFLITEMLKEPEFMDGRIWSDALYEINKSMKERINDLELSQADFKEYVELWIHEVKVPIATLSCMNYNDSRDLASQKQQIDKIRFYVEQILFLSRADNPQKDYLMKKVSLDKLVNQVIKNNKELLIGNKIKIEKEKLEAIVLTDAKWMEFILGQVVNNSVKYSGKNGWIRFEENEYENRTELVITDHGIGICEQDIPRVFEKTFTGENGRKVREATGMGLYICQKLCEKMGHKIWLESREGEYTSVHIECGKEDYYCV